MKFSHQELEKELASLRPAQATERLKSRIGQALAGREETRKPMTLKLWPVFALAAAACLTLLAVVFIALFSKTHDAHANGVGLQPSAKEPSETRRGEFQPVQGERRLLEAVDEGIVMTENRKPIRKLRYEFVDIVTLVNQNDGSVFTIEIPRKEILFVPVTLL